MRKQKDLKIGSPQWVLAWERLLVDGLVIRCMIEESLDFLHFGMEIYLIVGDDIYRMRFERFLGQTIKLPHQFIEKYNGPLQAFLSDLGAFWEIGKIPDDNCLERRKFMVAKPYRGVVRPLGTTNFFLMPPNHPLFMTGYGAVHEWASQAKRGFVSIKEAGSGLPSKPMLWGLFEQRFKSFLYQQQLSLLQNTVGRVASFE